MKFDVSAFFEKSAERSQVLLKSDNNNGYFTWSPTYIFLYLPEFLLEWEKFQKKVLEKIKTHILYSITFSRKSCRLWDNVEKYGSAGQAADDNIIRRMRIACWITKATDTHTLRICNTYCFSTAKVVTRTRLNVTSYVRCVSCWLWRCFDRTSIAA
jgi:hypothetical protein